MTLLIAAAVASFAVVCLGVVVMRRRRRRAPGVFTCRLRPTGPFEGTGRLRHRHYACWVHDVLIVHRGPTLARNRVLPIAAVTGPIIGAPTRGLGDRPVWLRLQLDNGDLFDLVARNVDLTLAFGPYVVASLGAVPPRPGPHPATGEV